MIVDLPPTHPVQVLSDAVREVVVSQTVAGLDIGRYPHVVVSVSTDPLDGAELTASPSAVFDGLRDRIVLAEPAPAALVRAGELLGVRWTAAQEAQVRMLVHEHLHGTTSGRLARFGDRGDRGVEEAVVDAVAADLHDQVVRTLTGRPSTLPDTGMSYGPCVARVRVASTVATRSTSWRTVAAAGWRARLLAAMPQERAQMLTETGTHPAEVC